MAGARSCICRWAESVRRGMQTRDKAIVGVALSAVSVVIAVIALLFGDNLLGRDSLPPSPVGAGATPSATQTPTPASQTPSPAKNSPAPVKTTTPPPSPYPTVAKTYTNLFIRAWVDGEADQQTDLAGQAVVLKMRAAGLPSSGWQVEGTTCQTQADKRICVVRNTNGKYLTVDILSDRLGKPGAIIEAAY